MKRLALKQLRRTNLLKSIWAAGPRLRIEPLEDRLAPATASFAGGHLEITFAAAGESVTITNDGTNFSVTGSAILGATALASLNKITVSDPSSTGSQTLSISGSVGYTLSNGLTSTDVETVTFNQGVTATSGSGISVTAPQRVEVFHNLTGDSAGITLIGQGTAALDTIGVEVSGATITTTNNGDVSVTGTGGAGSGGNNFGVFVVSGGTITAGGSGTVTVTGTGGAGNGNQNYGVWIAGSNSKINSSGGNVSVTGTGDAGNGNQNYGVVVDNQGKITSGGSGTVTIEGKGGAGSGMRNFGVYVLAGGTITSGGAGTVSVTGTGGSGTGSSNYGVYVVNSGSQITSSGGAVLVKGTGGGAGTSAGNYGVYIASSGVITSAGTGAGATVTVEGQGGNTSGTGGNSNYGVYVVSSGSQITSSGGAVLVEGVGTSNSEAVRLESAGAITSGSDASITLTADSVNLVSSTSIDSGSGTTTLRTRAAGTKIDLGGADVLSGSPLTLGLTNDEINRITAGTIVLGKSDSGKFTVSADITRSASANLELRSGNDIVVSGGQVNTAGGTLLLVSGTSPFAVQPTRAGTDATASTVSLNGLLDIAINGTTVDTQYSQLNVSGAVNLSGASLGTSGSFPGITGGETFTIVQASSVSGTFTGLPHGASVVVQGKTYLIQYNATNVQLVPPGTLNATLDGSGNLIVTDVGDVDNNITIQIVGSDLVISDTAEEFQSAPMGWTLSGDRKSISILASAFSKSITVNTMGGSDVVLVNFSGGDPIPDGNIFYNGGTGLSDALRIVGSGLSSKYTPDAVTAGSGTIEVLSQGTVTFTGLEPIDYDVVGGTLTLSLPGANDIVEVANSTLIDGVTPALKVSGSTGGVPFENARVRTSAIVIDTTSVDGDDTITITSANNAHGNTSLTIQTGSGTDTVSINGPTVFSTSVNISTVNVNSTAAGTLNPGTTGLTVTNTGTASTLLGAISGSGALVKNGSGTLTLGGTTANTYSGTTTVNTGILALNKTPGVNAIPGSLIIGDGVGGNDADVVRLLQSDQIANTSTVTILTTGLLELNGKNETLGALLTLESGTSFAATITTSGGFLPLAAGANVTLTPTGTGVTPADVNGSVVLDTGNRTFNVADGTGVLDGTGAANDTDLLINADLTGPGGIIKTGLGRLQLNNAGNTYAGLTRIDAGVFHLTGFLTGAGQGVTLNGPTTVFSGSGAMVGAGRSVLVTGLATNATIRDLIRITNTSAGSTGVSVQAGAQVCIVNVFGSTAVDGISGHAVNIDVVGGGTAGNTRLFLQGTRINSNAGGTSIGLRIQGGAWVDAGQQIPSGETGGAFDYTGLRLNLANPLFGNGSTGGNVFGVAGNAYGTQLAIRNLNTNAPNNLSGPQGAPHDTYAQRNSFNGVNLHVGAVHGVGESRLPRLRCVVAGLRQLRHPRFDAADAD